MRADEIEKSADRADRIKVLEAQIAKVEPPLNALDRLLEGAHATSTWVGCPIEIDWNDYHATRNAYHAYTEAEEAAQESKTT